jgi:nucleotide-binding universal stress UspA family protein
LRCPLRNGQKKKEIAMYKHILVPTDGSKLSAKAIRVAARLAGTFRLGSRDFACSSIRAARLHGGHDIVRITSPRQYKQMKDKEAKRALAVVDIEAQTAGVQASKISLTADQPWRAIIGTARSKKCDLIVMASHGRRGLAALLLGSETTKVLTHSSIPVLVCR